MEVNRGGYARAREVDRLDHPTDVGWERLGCGKPASATASCGGGATVLGTVKGRVLPVLAMLAPKRALRVAARGSGPGAEGRRP
jgi:hypothetical protein